MSEFFRSPKVVQRIDTFRQLQISLAIDQKRLEAIIDSVCLIRTGRMGCESKIEIIATKSVHQTPISVVTRFLKKIDDIKTLRLKLAIS